MRRHSVPCDTGYEDGYIRAYGKTNDILDVFVTAWNGKTIQFRFSSVVRVLDNDSNEICDFCEITEDSAFLRAAIERVYDVIPENIPYHHFQFIDIDDGAALEVVAEEYSISIEPS